jgi:hypothetical protein
MHVDPPGALAELGGPRVAASLPAGSGTPAVGTRHARRAVSTLRARDVERDEASVRGHRSHLDPERFISTIGQALLPTTTSVSITPAQSAGLGPCWTPE